MKAKTFSLLDMKKKGAVNVDKSIDTVVGVLVVIVLAANLAPEMFSSVAGLNDSDAPGWVGDAMFVIIGAGLVYLIWRVIQKGTK